MTQASYWTDRFIFSEFIQKNSRTEDDDVSHS